jgi:hypothetical protein
MRATQTREPAKKGPSWGPTNETEEEGCYGNSNNLITDAR